MKKSMCLIILLFMVLACDSIDTQMESNIIGEPVEYTAGETVLKGYLAYDGNQKGQRPGVLVVHEWWGHNEYARRRARMLAELGYTALAVDMYGSGHVADHPDDALKFAMATMTNMEESRARFEAGLDLLKKHSTTNPGQTAAIGYCFGGTVVLNMALQGSDLDAVVSFHAGMQGATPQEIGDVKAKLLVCNGAADVLVPPDQIVAFTQKLDGAGVSYEVINYENAMHSFTNPIADSVGKKFEMPLAYNAAADNQSWEAMKKLFSEVFGADH